MLFRISIIITLKWNKVPYMLATRLQTYCYHLPHAHIFYILAMITLLPPSYLVVKIQRFIPRLWSGGLSGLVQFHVFIDFVNKYLVFLYLNIRVHKQGFFCNLICIVFVNKYLYHLIIVMCIFCHLQIRKGANVALIIVLQGTSSIHQCLV